MKLINHLNSPIWTEKNKGQANGARSYSEVISKYYYPVFEEVLGESGKRDLLMTVTTENYPMEFRGYNRIFLFLHECRYKQQPTIARCRQFARNNPRAECWFIVWEQETAMVLKQNGLNAIFLPMAIDVEEVRSHLQPVPKYRNRIIWFGNIRGSKVPFYKHFVSEAHKKGFMVDRISTSRLNEDSRVLSRDEILYELQRYEYGIGVGICAHEMSALGLKVFIYSYNFYCNCAYSKSRGTYLINKNLCAPEEARIRVPDALDRRNEMVVISPVDVKQNAEYLRKELQKNFLLH